MRRRLAFRTSTVAALAVLSLSACGTLQGVYDNHFASQRILRINGEEAWIALRDNNSTRVGEELTVFRVAPNFVDAANKGRATRMTIGTVRIEAVAEDHIATARITTGSPAKGDFVGNG